MEKLSETMKKRQVEIRLHPDRIKEICRNMFSEGNSTYFHNYESFNEMFEREFEQLEFESYEIRDVH